MRRLALFLVFLGGCGSGGTPEEKAPANAAANAAATPDHPPPSQADIALSREAAEALRAYYGAIGRHDLGAAWRMREHRPGLAFDRYAASFERYADYRATVGVPSLPARQDGAVWVEVPVQLYGRMRDGAPFGSVGRVTMKREAGSREWRIVS